MVLPPPFDDGIADKIILVRGSDNDVVRGMDTKEKRKEVGDTFAREFPAFLAFLLAWEIPAELKADRFGIRSYHNPELMAKMRELQPEQRLLSLVDDCLFRYHDKQEFDGSALALQRVLTDSNYSLCHEARNLLKGPNSCGTYLGRLSKCPTQRVTQRVIHGQTRWKITAPEGSPEVSIH